MTLRIEKAKVCGPFSLELSFNDGTQKRVNVKPLLCGPIFQPLKKVKYFKAMKLDRTCGTVCWPNGADFAPEALHALKAARSANSSPTGTKSNGRKTLKGRTKGS